MSERPNITPRVVLESDAAAYVGKRPGRPFRAWATAHRVKPLRPRVNKIEAAYDVRDLDTAIDLEKGLLVHRAPEHIDWSA